MLCCKYKELKGDICHTASIILNRILILILILMRILILILIRICILIIQAIWGIKLSFQV